MLRRAKVDYLDKEDMMGHKVGLEKHYERYQEEDFERFPEYQKAIPFLTISDEERIRLENEKLKEEKSEVTKIQMKTLMQQVEVVKDLDFLKRSEEKILFDNRKSIPGFSMSVKDPKKYFPSEEEKQEFSKKHS